MIDPRQEALLAQWLDDPTSGPPEGLEGDVVESMIALRPELAPPPGVSLDDILAGVTEGPFAAHPDAAPTSLISDEELEARRSQMPATQADLIDLAAVRRRRRRIWGGVGTLAAAALVLFIIVPQDFEQSIDPPAPAEVIDEPSPAEPENFEASLEQEVLLEVEKDEDEDAERPMPATKKAAPAPPKAADQPEAPELQSSGAASTYGPAPELTGGGAGPGAAPTPAPAVYSEDMADEGAGPRLKSKQEPKRSGRRDRTNSTEAPTADDDQGAFADYEMEEEEEDIVREAVIPDDLESLRAAAAPRDYGSDWYLRALTGSELKTFSTAVEQAEAQASAGDYRAAAQTCLALAKSSDPRVAQDMSWRAARYTSMAGDSGALAIVRDGQRRSSANTVFRANLYHLEGSILESQGDIEGALVAYRVAANLNAARTGSPSPPRSEPVKPATTTSE